ncbi:MAG: hypothetical protein C4B58_16590 [Deltaproteobacteria bacterium]|nr:MAG: hypothetical protein C4B58_16590 [Deltaproteobacteria bacterium]
MKAPFRPPWFRKNYLVNPRIQFGPGWRLAIGLLVPLMALNGIFFYHLANHGFTWPDPIYRPLVELSVVFTLSVTCLTILVIGWLAVYLHRIIGGLKRVERHLEIFSETGEWREIKLRRHDLLHEFVDKLNKALGAAS